MKKIAFICVHNSCRSQIAEALAKKYCNDSFDIYSCGTEIKNSINSDAVRIVKNMYEIDMTKTQYPKLFEDIPQCDIYISMGCNVQCPFIPNAENINWGLEDPTGKDDKEFIKIIKIIEDKVLKLKGEITNN